MKTKKLLSFMLTIAMVLSMVAALGITASAAFHDILTYDANNENATGEVAEHDAVAINAQNPVAIATVAGKGTLAVEGYVFAGWNTQDDGKGTTYYPGATIEVSADMTLYAVWVNAADVTAYLDLDANTTTITDTKTLDQNYSLTVSTGSYTDVTKVKVEWTLQDITAARIDNQIWDPDTLSWVTADSAVTANSATASFHLTNLSSVKVDAKVEFAAVAGFDPTVVYTGVDAMSHKTTLNTVVTGTDVDTSITHDATVTVKVTPSTTDFTNAAATNSAKYGTYTVTLCKYVAVESVVLSNNTLALDTITNKTATLTATVSPSTATENTVTWSSDNNAVATVDANGKVSAVGAGTATITAAVGAKSATCTVNVAATIPVIEVSLNQTELTLTSNDPSNKTATLIATVTPNNATNKTVTWSSGNTAVATVDANGNVTAVEYAHGTAVITASADGVEVTCTVTVNCNPE